MQIGVDFGGTKIEVAALDAAGEFAARVRAPTPPDYEAAIVQVCELVTDVERRIGARATIGVGMPGSLSPVSGVMRNANSTWLNGRSFREDLRAALGRDIRMANDANCLALSEAVDGAAARSTVTFAAILGTGCGGGLVVNGELVEGAHAIGGEWGHVPLPWPRADELDISPCWCGQRGCLETWVSGTGLQRDYLRRNGRTLSGEQVVERARGDDPDARDALRDYIDRLGRGLAMVCNIVDPDTIVLGGGLSNVPELYAQLPQVVRSRVFSDTWSGRIVPARWGDSSGVRGAARLWKMP